MRRREFIKVIAALAAWPFAARAQQPERMPRIGVLMTLTEDNAEGQARMMGFLQALQQLGWTAGRNVRIDYRWGADNAVRTRKYAAELVALEPDVLLCGGTPALILALAARHRLPTIYPARFFAASGGLISYGPDRVGQYRRAAAYVDRILKGEKPADLPIQASDKYELVVNLKTAKALGLAVPPSVLARADEVIE